MSNRNNILPIIGFLVALAAGQPTAAAATKKAESAIQLTEAGKQLEARYAATFTALRAEITKVLPNVSEQNKTALQKARDSVKAAEAQANAAQQSLGKIQTARALVDHAKGKWIGGAEFSKYGRALEICAAIQKASEGVRSSVVGAPAAGFHAREKNNWKGDNTMNKLQQTGNGMLLLAMAPDARHKQLNGRTGTKS
jgi:hypothetical protein